MRKTKRFAAAVAAMAMAVSMVAATGTMTAFADYTITISNSTTDKGTHSFVYSQIFTGTVSADSKITAASFGSGVDGAELVAALKADATVGTAFAALAADASADDVIAAMSTVTDADALARVIKKVATTTPLTDSTEVPAGYYLIADAAAPTAAGGVNSGAQTAFMLKIVHNVNLETATKSAAPTVDKQVYDNDDKATTGDNNVWGETADHTVTDTFQFRLIATIPDDQYIEKYTTYSLNFVDTLGTGVVFDSIDSVKIGDTVDTATDFGGTYNCSATAGTTGEWTLDITDVTQGHGGSAVKGKVVVVTYNAHLDPSTCNVAGSSTDFNENKVKLEYSNNPNYKGNGTQTEDSDGNKNTKGETPEDKVFVYTYKVTNVKVDAANHNTKLNNAVFNVKKGDETLKFTWNEAKKAYAYDPAGTADITSKNDGTSDGIFSFYGLDAGTYTITEKTAPQDYNLNKTPLEVKIVATHSETNDAPTLDLTGSTNTNNVFENTQGAILPETGGFGTTMFFVGGGAVAAAAGVVLVARRRAKREE